LPGHRPRPKRRRGAAPHARRRRRGRPTLLRPDADRYPEASRLPAGPHWCIDLAALAAERQDGLCADAVAIDEFGALAAEHVSRLFARARGTGISLLLGDAVARRPARRPDDALAEQVLSNVSYPVALRIADLDSAERLARMPAPSPPGP
jgi:hypothetical protein